MLIFSSGDSGQVRFSFDDQWCSFGSIYFELVVAGEGCTRTRYTHGSLLSLVLDSTDQSVILPPLFFTVSTTLSHAPLLLISNVVSPPVREIAQRQHGRGRRSRRESSGNSRSSSSHTSSHTGHHTSQHTSRRSKRKASHATDASMQALQDADDGRRDSGGESPDEFRSIPVTQGSVVEDTPVKGQRPTGMTGMMGIIEESPRRSVIEESPRLIVTKAAPKGSDVRSRKRLAEHM